MDRSSSSSSTIYSPPPLPSREILSLDDCIQHPSSTRSYRGGLRQSFQKILWSLQRKTTDGYIEKSNMFSEKFIWTLQNFSYLVTTKEPIESQLFQAKKDTQTRWMLEVVSKENVVSFYWLDLRLHLKCSDYFESKVTVKIKLKNKQGDTIVSYKKGPIIIEREGFCTGDLKIAKRIVVDDELSIFCKVDYLYDEKKRLQEFHKNCPELSDSYEELLNKEYFYDFTLNCDNQEIKVHKCIMAIRSPVFLGMFNTAMKEAETTQVEIEDIPYPILMDLVRYIYSGKLPILNETTEELLRAADKYAVLSLINAIEQQIIEAVNKENRYELFNICKMFNLTKAVKHIKEFGEQNNDDNSD